MMRPLALIAAISQNGVLGRDNDIPWHYPEDFRFFRRMTVGHAIVMGRKTFESLGKLLPGRTHIVLTRQTDFQAPGCHVYHDFQEALQAAHAIDPCPFLIGGAQLYEMGLPYTTLMYLTRIPKEVEGDVTFPEVNWDQWDCIERQTTHSLTFETYNRIQEESAHG
jgi:dihydrofolate reductase